MASILEFQKPSKEYWRIHACFRMKKILIVANTSVSSVWEGDVLVDYDLNARTLYF